MSLPDHLNSRLELVTTFECEYNENEICFQIPLETNEEPPIKMVGLTDKHNAAESATGYLYQCLYALLATIREGFARADLEISIEQFDDVSFASNGAPDTLIQTKHHVKRRGSLSNASVDLWKTLGIWSQLVHQDPLLPSRMRFYLVTTSNAVPGSAASYLCSLERDEAKAKEILTNTAIDSSSNANRSSYLAFSQLADAEQLALLRSITIFDNSSLIAEIESDLRQLLRLSAPKGKVHLLTERLVGWWFSRVIESLSAPQPPIHFSEIENKIEEIHEGLTRQSLPVDCADLNVSPEIIIDHDNRVFVQQLRLVRIGRRRIEFAIRDFYRAFAQRSRWANERLLVNDETVQYEQKLLEAWEPRFEEMIDRIAAKLHPSDPEEAGAKIFQWVETEADVPFRTVRERFLCHGSFHMLSDDCKVGWHPDFKRLLCCGPDDTSS